MLPPLANTRIANGSEVELNLVRLLLEDTALSRSDIFIRVYILYYFNHGRGTAKYRESVCLSVCLSASVSQKPVFRTSLKCPYVVLRRRSILNRVSISDDILFRTRCAVATFLPVLWMTSRPRVSTALTGDANRTCVPVNLQWTLLTTKSDS